MGLTYVCRRDDPLAIFIVESCSPKPEFTIRQMQLASMTEVVDSSPQMVSPEELLDKYLPVGVSPNGQILYAEVGCEDLKDLITPSGTIRFGRMTG